MRNMFAKRVEPKAESFIALGAEPELESFNFIDVPSMRILRRNITWLGTRANFVDSSQLGGQFGPFLPPVVALIYIPDPVGEDSNVD